MKLLKIRGGRGFTLIELLTVISVIAVLTGLILGTAGYVQRKAATSRTQSEIKAIEAACEGYKADNGIYPVDINNTTTKALNCGGSNPDYNPADYTAACAVLYQAITGDGIILLAGSGAASNGKMASAGKCYMELKPSQTGSSGNTYYIVDPFGFSYGYSTAQAATGTNGYNTTYDLWSTAGSSTIQTSATAAKWITNW